MMMMMIMGDNGDICLRFGKTFFVVVVLTGTSAIVRCAIYGTNSLDFVCSVVPKITRTNGPVKFCDVSFDFFVTGYFV
jgi:hypothetical protein